MNSYGRQLALVLVVGLAACSSGGATPASDGVAANSPAVHRPAPAAAGSLAYILDGDVYVADPDGSNALKIANGISDCNGGGEYWTEGGLWSPDGRYLAYRRTTDCSGREAGWDVVISDAKGNVLATFPAQGWRTAWSPDSTRVAVWDTWPKTIGVYGLDGARQTQLRMRNGSWVGNDTDPVWTSDGTSLMVGGKVALPLDGSTPRLLSPVATSSDDYSPDGSHIVYVDRGGSLTIARSDGSERRKVFGAGADIGPTVWSPTGDRIAFETGGAGVYVFDVATGSLTLVTEGERGVELGVSGFSPKGDRILFSKATVGPGPPSLWSIRVDGSDARLIVAGTTQGWWLSPADTRPAPAAAGTLAYFNHGDVYVADPDGSNVVKVADGRSEADCLGDVGEYWAQPWDSVWSPDGRYFAYRYTDCSSAPDHMQGGVVISDAEGDVVAKFPTGRGWNIDFSPDSTRVAVWEVGPRDLPAFEGDRTLPVTIGIYGVDGVRQMQITVPTRWGAGLDSDPHWTPDGTSLVVADVELPLDGGAPRSAASAWGNMDHISSPDGSRVAYVDRRSLMVARADGSNPREVLGNCVGAPVWSPTGDRIAITTDDGGRSPIELRVVDVATGSATPVTEAEHGSGLEVVGFTPHGDRIFFSTGSGGSWSGWSIGVDGSDPRLSVDGTPHGSFARFIVDHSDNFWRAPWSPGAGGG